MKLFSKIKESLKKTRENFSMQLNGVFSRFNKVDEALLEELEEVLILADMGTVTTETVLNKLREKIKLNKLEDPSLVKEALISIIRDILDQGSASMNISSKPSAVLLVGVNGSGKTTACARLAAFYKEKNLKVILGAADTFRAAASEQLEIWAKKIGVDIVRNKEGTDPAAVVYDTIKAAKARSADIIICDTAGRLHNKKNLMDELKKINGVFERELTQTETEVLFVLDASTGQNALSQAIEFKKATKITGVVLTKLDGTAKGGVVIAVCSLLGVPIKFIGVGEKAEDIEEFDADNFVNALFD